MGHGEESGMGRLYVIFCEEDFRGQVADLKLADTSVGALVSLIAFTIGDSIQVWRYGGGRHTYDLPPEWYNGFLRVSFAITRR